MSDSKQNNKTRVPTKDGWHSINESSRQPRRKHEGNVQKSYNEVPIVRNTLPPPDPTKKK